MQVASESDLTSRCDIADAVKDFDDPGNVDDLDAPEGAEGIEDIEDTAVESEADGEVTQPPAAASGKPGTSRRVIMFGLAVVVVLSTLVSWLGFRAVQSHQDEVQRSRLLQAARQSALNLTTIDWHHADADVHRIMDGATAEFYEDFARRSQPFIDVIKKFQSTSVGTVTEAALETETGDAAQALVAVTVTTSNAGKAEQFPRSWRLRISVQTVDNQMKVSNVEFVP
ncbi:hypothetical protein [[Mycobacterium] nativiensis]|uniref:Mammalian cell entry protein n=1 Tax=[Mycobacterium] nativiensis TaxID=2855503 RepID=A0ABU5XPZ8_9MYCO|nr:hypothetical protein [Mycolicibacter sp. MYC340]MEB3030047.1 hypothetical protein [Mycolicibacter sp. MYC340]